MSLNSLKTPVKKMLVVLLALGFLGTSIFSLVSVRSLEKRTAELESASQGSLNNGAEKEAVSNETSKDLSCSQGCKDYLADYLAEASKETTEASLPVQTIITPPKTAKTTTVSYLTVPGSGSTLENDWTDLAGTEFFFDLADYPGVGEIRFEVNMHLTNANGQAYIRLYDVTHGMAVHNSEAHTGSQTAGVVTSGLITFWAGRNIYRVQAKSITADTTNYNSGRLKITTTN